MRRKAPSLLALAALLPLLAAPALAQESGGEAEPAAEAAPPVKPKPARKKPVVKKPVAKAPAVAAPSPDPAPAGEPRKESPKETPKSASEGDPKPYAPPASTPMASQPGLTVSCDGKAALFEGPNAFVVWVTRSGAIVVENPLRPLTPETTRILQLVIGGKSATAYGPDLFALRRGGAPAALEAVLGAPARWDSAMTPLPDTIAIVSDSGAPLASLAFRECGEAPFVKPPPAPPKARKPGAGKAGAGKAESGPKAPPGFRLPQGAIP